MKAKKIINTIEEFCPLYLAYDWDNPGLLCGNENKTVKRVFLTLDTNLNTVKEAVEKKADMIVSHHPILFRGIKKIDSTAPEGQMLELLLKNDTVLYAAHTNLDCAEQGINQYLAQLFGLKNIKVLEKNNKNPKAGLGRWGKLPQPMNFSEFSSLTKKLLNTPCIKTAGNPQQSIKKAAIGSGSCSELIPLAIENKADVIITADLKYHEVMNYAEQGICIIDAGHYPTEICVLDIFENMLKELPGITLIKSENQDIFHFC